MIKNVKLAKEIVVMAEHKPGVFAAVASVLADRGISMTAVSAQAAGGVGLINFVADEHLRACDLLRKKKMPYHENGVLLVEVDDKPGIFRKLTSILASKKINILNVYGSAVKTYESCLLVLSTDNNQKASVLLRNAI
ncbi:MAG: hypothetical protein A2Z83_09370 [Omnitrophica bacterium GWA2_52_8]|nr:MAG: hypothetical protein A2Z83_09370 [Omnitrophica bacterium GWA2_52_8]